MLIVVFNGKIRADLTFFSVTNDSKTILTSYSIKFIDNLMYFNWNDTKISKNWLLVAIINTDHSLTLKNQG